MQSLYSKTAIHYARRALMWMFALTLACAAAAHADEIPLQRAELVPVDEGGYSLSADYGVSLTERLDSALSKGVPLYFVVEFETTRPRWYWFDARVITKRLETRLSFHALTRTYRLSTGTQHLGFNNLNEALRTLGTVRGWQVLNPSDLEPLSTYNVGVRVFLDVNQLPKPFQVSALANAEWTLSSAWQRWGFSTGATGKIVQ